MSWILFDEHGNRAQKLFVAVTGDVLLGWIPGLSDFGHNVLGFDPAREWRPTYFAAKMSKGYRVFEIDEGVFEYIGFERVTDFWQAGVGKRLPTIAAVEMWVRHRA